jgi:uncharacterized protein YgiM (DUF1202 family)
MDGRKRVVLLLLIVLALAGFQSFEPTGLPDPNANITWPPPIYNLSGEFSVRGTANVPGMASYFLEFRPLNPDFSPLPDTTSWTPAILPARGPVIDDVLGVWNTLMAPDGAYELRLTISTGTGAPVYARVSPLRILNQVPPFAITATPLAVPTLVPNVVPTIDNSNQQLPTLVPTPTAFSTTPEAVAVTNGNVRSGDNTNYPVVGSLIANQRVQLVGRSNSGSGWWYVQLPNGTRGWVAPSVVQVSGDLTSLPRINPPATPTPLATATPTLPDAIITNVRFDREIREGENFQLIVTVRNESGVPLPRTTVACNFTPMNEFYSTNVEGLGAFSQVDVAMTVRLDEGGGDDITANCAVDVNNEIAEINNNNNFFNRTERLRNPGDDDDN